MSDDAEQTSPTRVQMRARRALIDLKHGGHVIAENVESAESLAARQDNMLLARADVDEDATPFDYLFPDLPTQPDKLLLADDPAAVVADLILLGDAMVEDPPLPADPLQSTNNSVIPPVYTYWGQFVDHDLTANTDRSSVVGDVTNPDLQPLPPDVVTRDLKNLRTPTLNLDSVYADGPTFGDGPRTAAAGFYEGVRFRIGTNATQAPPIPESAEVPPPETDVDRDLPRIGPLLDSGIIQEEEIPETIRETPNVRFKAFIGDMRNDENLIVSQLHLAFLRFHNEVVNWLEEHEGGCDQAERFNRARNLVQWHYQWLVVHDFLKTVTLSGVVDKVLLRGPQYYALRDGQIFMPLEYSVAAFRFGHSMVRGVYDFNRNFGRPGNVIPQTSFDLLFLFTGNGFQRQRDGSVTLNPFGGQGPTLPFSWIIEWDRFIDRGSAFPDHFARKIDTQLAPPLRDLVNEGNEADALAIRTILKRLARRNLLRGYLLSIPTGQALAEAMGVPPLDQAELSAGNNVGMNDVLREAGFLERTPLWYYVLKEAEVRANGNSLGELGSRILCETIIGLLVNDPASYLNQEGGWDPSKGVKLANGDPIATIGDFLEFATVLPRP